MDMCEVCGAEAPAAGHWDDPGNDTRTLCRKHEYLRGQDKPDPEDGYRA